MTDFADSGLAMYATALGEKIQFSFFAQLCMLFLLDSVFFHNAIFILVGSVTFASQFC